MSSDQSETVEIKSEAREAGVGDAPNDPIAPANDSATEENVVATPSPAERIKVDWYQTEADIVINVLAKGIKKEDVNVDYQANNKIFIKFGMPTGELYERTLNLFKEINLDSCSMKVMSTKLELRMKKLDASSWKSLEAVAVPAEVPPTYPSSSKVKKDWAKLDKELAKEKDEQDVNTLFSTIFESGDDNTKKAMIKSMQESGGTVLSTNWEEVGKKRVEISPPDGMEFRKWDE